LLCAQLIGSAVCLVVLQASLPETTYFCIENKLAERASNRRQPEQS